MKVGLLITCYNRPEYLRQTLDSLSKADLSQVTMLIVDDSSTDAEAMHLIRQHKFIRTPYNMGIKFSIQMGLDWFFQDYYDAVINLDSDTIVKPDFVETLLALHKRFPDSIVSGFNTLTANSRGVIRHPVVAQGEGYVIKNSIGGVNMLIPRSKYRAIRESIVRSQQIRTQWDREVCMSITGGIIVSSPSCVQHIGVDSSMRHHDNPDVADDFEVNERKLLVLQPHGLGDIIFCQALVRSRGYNDITWPVVDTYLEDCKRAYPDINFISYRQSPVSLESRERRSGGYEVMPIRFSDTIQHVPYKHVMRAKYDMYGTNWQTWNKVGWKRDVKKEYDLYAELGLIGRDYVVVNNRFGWQGNMRASVSIGGFKKIVVMENKPGYSLFDWSRVLECATEIHTVSTSILFIIDQLKTGDVHVYLRKPVEQSHQNYDYIFTDKKYIYH